MIDKKEINKIVKDIDEDLTDYAIGKKYKHSPHSIASIRKEYDAQKMEAKKEEERKELEQKELEREEKNIDVGALKDMDVQMAYETGIAPTRAQVEKVKAKEHSERIMSKVEEIISEEDEALARGIQSIATEKKKKIIDEYERDVIDKQFNPNYLREGSHWYNQEMLNAYVVPRDERIKVLEEQISQMEKNYPAELARVKAEHKTELVQAKAQARDALLEGDNIFCYACGQPLSKAHLHIPCANCFNRGWTLQVKNPVITQQFF